MVNDQLEYLSKSKRMSMEDFHLSQINEDEAALNRIKKSSVGRQAVANAYHIPKDYLDKQEDVGYTDIGADLNKIWYGDNGSSHNKDPRLVGNLSDIFNRLS